MRIAGFAQYLFAVASAGLALLSLCFGGFAPGGVSLPAWLPAREIWGYGFAAIVLAGSVGLCYSRTASRGALAIGAYLAAWAALCIPQVLARPLSFDGWYGFCEAMSALLGAWLLYATLRATSQRALRVAQVLFGCTCVFYGASHFAYATYTAAMVPAWLHGQTAFAYITGLAHIAAGIGIGARILARLAATLEAAMMGLFGLLVWVPSFFMQPTPAWATPAQNQWSELVVTLVLTASAWVVANSLSERAGVTSGR